MTSRNINALLLSAFVFILLAGVAFLFHKQKFFASHEGNISIVNQTPASSNVPLGNPTDSQQDSKKALKSFGFCGDPSKNESILSYSPDLLNALLDDVQGSHCEAPKPDYPNFTFLLPDTSLVRIAEMTPDYKYIFYLKVETNAASSTYYLHKIDVPQKQTVLLETATISSDWPLQKDFYEDFLLPRYEEGTTSPTLKYFWFKADPKGKTQRDDYLKEKTIVL